MRRIGRLAAGAVAGVALVLSFPMPAQADVSVSNGFGAGGYTRANSQVWVSLWEGKNTWVEWETDTGKSGTCAATTRVLDATCTYDFSADSTITLRVCSDMFRTCSEWVTDRIRD